MYYFALDTVYAIVIAENIENIDFKLSQHYAIFNYGVSIDSF